MSPSPAILPLRPSAARPSPLSAAAARESSELDERQSRESRQMSHAAALKIERIARREPIVNSLLLEHAALKTVTSALRERNGVLELANAELGKEVARLTKSNEALGAQLAANASRLTQAQHELAAALQANEAAAEAAKALRAELAAALKPKKG